MGAHDALHGGKTEPAAGELGREERIENLGEGFRGHSAAGVMDFEHDVGTGAKVVAVGPDGSDVLLVDSLRTGADKDSATFGSDRLGAVDHQIHDDLL